MKTALSIQCKLIKCKMLTLVCIAPPPPLSSSAPTLTARLQHTCCYVQIASREAQLSRLPCEELGDCLYCKLMERGSASNTRYPELGFFSHLFSECKKNMILRTAYNVLSVHARKHLLQTPRATSTVSHITNSTDSSPWQKAHTHTQGFVFNLWLAVCEFIC